MKGKLSFMKAPVFTIVVSFTALTFNISTLLSGDKWLMQEEVSKKNAVWIKIP